MWHRGEGWRWWLRWRGGGCCLNPSPKHKLSFHCLVYMHPWSGGLLCATDLEKPKHDTSLHHPLQPMVADGVSGQWWGEERVAKQPVVTLTWSENRNLVSGWNIRPDPKPSCIHSKDKAVFFLQMLWSQRFCSCNNTFIIHELKLTNEVVLGKI